MTLHPPGHHTRNTTVVLAEWAVTDDLIAGQTFENCHIQGPAVVVPLGQTVIQGCTFDGPIDAVLWRIEDTRDRIIGAIGLENCRFYGCRFARVGVAVPEAQYEKFRAGFQE